MPVFKDNFSKQSDVYVKYRPHYPGELFSFLSSLTNEHKLAWDCGTGNGQAATGLAKFYDRIIATDPSAQQIGNCLPNEKVTYLVEKAEQSSLQTGSVDLLTIANALHWFDFESFYKEANRVLKPNGVIAAWAYALPKISPAVDEVIAHLHYQTLDAYWVHENRLVENEYKEVPFPFELIASPDFHYEKAMSCNDMTGYLNTWSATHRFIAKNQFNPVERMEIDLQRAWGDPMEEKKVRWKLIMKIGRVTG